MRKRDKVKSRMEKRTQREIEGQWSRSFVFEILKKSIFLNKLELKMCFFH
jgi:hypothetical protein